MQKNIFLKDEFYKETGMNWENSQGEPDIDYVEWLEKILSNFIVRKQEFSSCCTASVRLGNSPHEGKTNYYICNRCNNSCDITPSSEATTYDLMRASESSLGKDWDKENEKISVYKKLPQEEKMYRVWVRGGEFNSEYIEARYYPQEKKWGCKGFVEYWQEIKQPQSLQKATEICPSCKCDEKNMPCQVCDNTGYIYHQIMPKDWKLKEGFVKKVLSEYTQEKISFSRMVELFNEQILSYPIIQKEGNIIEECLKEVYLLRGEDKDIDLQLAITLNPHLSIIKKAMELYLSRTLEEGANELPSEKEIADKSIEKSKEQYGAFYETEEKERIAYHNFYIGAKYMRDKASIIIVSLHSKLEAKDKELNELKLEYAKGADLSQKLISQLKEANNISDTCIRICNCKYTTNNFTRWLIHIARCPKYSSETKSKLSQPSGDKKLAVNNLQEIEREIDEHLKNDFPDTGDKKTAEEICKCLDIFNSTPNNAGVLICHNCSKPKSGNMQREVGEGETIWREIKLTERTPPVDCGTYLFVPKIGAPVPYIMDDGANIKFFKDNYISWLEPLHIQTDSKEAVEACEHYFVDEIINDIYYLKCKKCGEIKNHKRR